MKISIRRGVFETNSSSTHSLTVASPGDFHQWAAGIKLLAHNYSRDDEMIDIGTALDYFYEDRTRYGMEYFTGEKCNTVAEFLDFAAERSQSFREEYPSYSCWSEENSGDSSLATFCEKHQLPGTTDEEDAIYLFGMYGYDG